jgi:magnesium chelatase family protein
MVGIVFSYTTIGIDAQQISVECDGAGSIFGVNIVGMASNAVKESKDRVFAALKNSGWEAYTRRYTINLAPADLKKDSSSLDLPIAISVLQCIKQLKHEYLTKIGIIGELSLDGNVRAVNGALPIALKARQEGMDVLIVPYENAEEAAIIDGLTVIPVTSLRETVEYLRGDIQIPAAKVDKDKIFQVLNDFPIDMIDVKGQFQVKRALEVSAAGGHNLLMLGPPGRGKNNAARRCRPFCRNSLWTKLGRYQIHSVAGNSKQFRMVSLRPALFRSPHHTISEIALSAVELSPNGENKSSHRGVLFLDGFLIREGLLK